MSNDERDLPDITPPPTTPGRVSPIRGGDAPW